jgi:DNA processing protein
MSEIQEKAGRVDTICRMRSIKWVSWTDVEYPPLLRELYDPPSILYYKGILPNPEKPLLGMVGTRKPSREAAEQAYKIAGNLGREGISVISGLAHGIDAMSHRGNLISNVPGYAVLGSGIDEVYPSSNRPLAKRILDSGGAIISEYQPGVHPTKFTFPARNRIIAAFSRSVLIVEAPRKSGALITASFALDQGKDLWVASCGLFEAASCDNRSSDNFDRRGTIKLASEGAEIIYSACDVLEKWNMKENNSAVKETALTMGSNREEMLSSMTDFLKI